jgi:tetratricopeptide (TPR) repeat protein
LISFDPDAESICEKSLKEALNYQPDSIDALLQLSNLRILRCKDEEALSYMDKVYDHIINLLIHNNNPNGELPPSSDIIINLAKNYSELKLYVKAVNLYDICLKINDEDVIFFIQFYSFLIFIKI